MVRVGIAGIGFMGMIHYLAYQRLGSRVQVVAMCEKDRDRLHGDWRSIKGNFGPQGTIMNLEGIAKYENLEEFVQDPNIDMVDICLPPWLHAPAAMAALRAGKHVLCEKPIALRIADAEQMVQTAEQAGRQLMVGQVLPFFAPYRFAYEAARDGRYGKLLGGHFERIISDPLWLKDFWDPNACGGPMVDLHIHDAHYIRLLFGMPRAVRTIGRMRGEVAEFFQTQFLFDDPSLMVSAICGVIFQQGRPFNHAYEIHFEKATVAFDLWANLPVTVLTEDGRVERPELPGGDEIDAFAAELAEALTAVETGKPSPLLDGRLARDALLLGEKQTESLRCRREIPIA
jgi:predicted dehydrogenase